MSEFDIMFPIPSRTRNADDMGMPSPIQREARLCILKMRGTEIEGWIIATGLEDARQRALAGGQVGLAKEIQGMVAPRDGRIEIPGGYVMLVG